MYQTIAELSAFSSAAQSLLSEDERRELISYLAQEPKAGVLIQGTGGVRKLRWAKGNRGKSAGVRVIYYFYRTARKAPSFRAGMNSADAEGIHLRFL
ncbi:hypothetical protein [Ferrovum myxofaciens]|uniref:hypothetical protein n=1 Tax=Ferrovum myxofaciens TaxID=416213 RepID=UPI003EBC0353